MRVFTLLSAVFLIAGCNNSLPAPSPSQVENHVANRIPKSQLEAMFNNIQSTTKWDMNGEMLWGYFFTDPDRAALEKAAKALEDEGYRYVDIFQPEDEGKRLPYFFLHVEKVEMHNVDSLYERNTQLEAFARRHGLDTYDGMDVGPVESPPSQD